MYQPGGAYNKQWHCQRCYCCYCCWTLCPVLNMVHSHSQSCLYATSLQIKGHARFLRNRVTVTVPTSGVAAQMTTRTPVPAGPSQVLSPWLGVILSAMAPIYRTAVTSKRAPATCHFTNARCSSVRQKP